MREIENSVEIRILKEGKYLFCSNIKLRRYRSSIRSFNYSQIDL